MSPLEHLPDYMEPVLVYDVEYEYHQYLGWFFTSQMTGDSEGYWMMAVTQLLTQNLYPALAIETAARYYSLTMDEPYRTHWAQSLDRLRQDVHAKLGGRPITAVGWAPQLRGSQLAFRYRTTHFIEVPPAVLESLPTLTLEQRYKLLCLIANHHFAGDMSLDGLVRLAMDHRLELNQILELTTYLQQFLESALGTVEPSVYRSCVAMVDRRSPILGLRVDTDFVY